MYRRCSMSDENKQRTEPIICDTDAGSDVDDYLALSYLVNAVPERFKLVSTTYGPVDVRAKAVATLFQSMRADIQVVPGVRKLMTPEAPIWLTGEEDYLVDQTAPVSDEDMLDAYLKYDSFTLLAIGPLTNIAYLIQNPEFVKRCSRIVIMGGTIHRQILQQEHNFHADSVATKIVLESEIPKVLIPLELTAPVPMTEEYYQMFSKGTTDYGKLLWSWVSNWRKVTNTSWNVTYPDGRTEIVPITPPFYDNVHWHDPIAAAFITNPELFKVETMRAHIDDEGGLVFGHGAELQICTDMDMHAIELIASTILKHSVPHIEEVEGQIFTPDLEPAPRLSL